jgi:hypothetical protein
MTKAPTLEILGMDTTGRLIISGMFEFYDRYGMRPVIFWLKMKQAHLVPSLVEFARKAVQAGWTDGTIVGLVRECWVDDPEYDLPGIEAAVGRFREGLKQLRDHKVQETIRSVQSA